MRRLAVLALLLITSACATEDLTQEPVVETILTTELTTNPSTTPSTSAETTTITELPAPVNIRFEPGIVGSPPDGLPESFLGVTTDSSVVEINTFTGNVVRTLITLPEDELADPQANRIGKAWWHRASQRLVVEEVPEPAAGTIFHLAAGRQNEDLRERCFEETSGMVCGFGWQAALSPNGDYVFHSGYFALVLEHGLNTSGIDVAPAGANQGGSFFHHPVFLMDRPGVAFVEQWDEGRRLHIVELDGFGQVVERTIHDLQFDIASMAIRSDGRLVLLEADRRWGFTGQRAEVIDPDTGETVAEFGLEPGSNSLGYDPSGTYLLYIDGSGTARWQGRGQTGVLADGLNHADW